MMIETFMDFCSGIGGGRLGLEQSGLKCVGYSDTARLSPITYHLMHNTQNEKNYGNLKRINTSTLPSFDMLIAGFPCQTFSVIGRKEGFSDDRGQIIFHLARIINETQPACFLLENVRGLVTHDKRNTLKIILNELNEVGYDVTYKVLNSLDFGVPQMRQRVYFVGFRKNLNTNINDFEWPHPTAKPSLANYLIDSNAASEERLEILHYYLNNPTNKGKYTVDDICEMEGKIIDTRMNDLRIYEERCPTLRAQRDGVLYVRNGVIYQLTGYEALLLQGFPQEYADRVKEKVTDRHLLMQAGNAMTVNVIKDLGNSIINFLKKRRISIMSTWEDFEIKCTEYLNNYFGAYAKFTRQGGSNSTVPDIFVEANGGNAFYIEVKEPNAQSGQFVLLPDEINKKFVFSPRNKTQANEFTEIITEHMNNNFDSFNSAGTAGQSLDIDRSIFGQWIVDYFKSKGVKYFITKGTNYIIFPTSKFESYFDITAKYRIKRSGSSEPSKKYQHGVIAELKSEYEVVNTTSRGKKLFVSGDSSLNKVRFMMGDYEYYLAAKDDDMYEVRQLSNTYNMNVIFSISLKGEQNPLDWATFEREFLNIKR